MRNLVDRSYLESALARMGPVLWGLVLVGALTLAGCGDKGRGVSLTATTEVTARGVSIVVKAGDPVKLRLKGDPEVEKADPQMVGAGRAEFFLRATDLKPGKTYKVRVVVADPGAKGSVTVTFTTLKVKPKVLFARVRKKGPLVSVESHRGSVGGTSIHLDPQARLELGIKKGVGNTLLLGGKTVALKTNTVIIVDPRQFMADQTVKDLAKGRFVVPMKVKSAKGDTFDDPLVISGRSLAKWFFQGIVKGGLPFAKEAPASAKARGYVLVTPGDKNYSPRYGIGSGKLAHADRVVVRRKELRRAGSCGPYRIVGKGGRVRMTKYTTVVTLTAYDRRTGKKLQSKTFRGTNPSCPRRATSATLSLFGKNPEKAVNTWLAGLLK